MKLQTIFSKFNLRTISAALCVSLVSSCAYDAYPSNSSYGGSPYGTPYGSPYGNSSTVSDPTIPLILGASAIGALAYYGKKKRDDRHDNHYYPRSYNNYGNYSHNRNNYNHGNYRSNQHSSNRNHGVNYNNHSIHSNHSNYNRSTTRDNSRNSAREALERKRDSQQNTNRSRPQTTRPHHSQVVSTSSSRSSQKPSMSRQELFKQLRAKKNTTSGRFSSRN